MRQDGETEQRIARLEEEIRLRDEFISIAAHELRNPLTPISLDVEMLLMQARRRPHVDPAEIAHLERLQRNLRTFLRRASTLLDVTRLQSGNLALESRSVVLADIVRQVVASSAPLAEQARCDLRVETDDSVVGECDPQALERIVENLLSNALRFGAGLPVDVRLRRAAGAAELQVADHGIGIAVAEQERIFKRFHRAPGADVPGFGVGLWITRALARAMDGDVTVSSSPGEGATFILRMPLRRRRDAAHVDT
ncbi:MAG TPA: HAMP domain-containing sensor histidine kinase [Nevskiaceae bacterium]|nr:HAMP domain-containing sensor histidine kinase [Nevskiaceae bacterium]